MVINIIIKNVDQTIFIPFKIVLLGSLSNSIKHSENIPKK